MRLDGWTGLDVTRPQAGVLLITLDHPERLNALTVAMKRDLIELLTQVQADDETRAVVLTGAGRAFCSGDYVHPDYTKEQPGSVPMIEGGHSDAASTYSALKMFSQAVNRALRARRQADHRRHQRPGRAERPVAWRWRATCGSRRRRPASAAARCASA